jgi:hypothetical protein
MYLLGTSEEEIIMENEKYVETSEDSQLTHHGAKLSWLCKTTLLNLVQSSWLQANSEYIMAKTTFETVG